MSFVICVLHTDIRFFREYFYPAEGILPVDGSTISLQPEEAQIEVIVLNTSVTSGEFVG